MREWGDFGDCRRWGGAGGGGPLAGDGWGKEVLYGMAAFRGLFACLRVRYYNHWKGEDCKGQEFGVRGARGSWRGYCTVGGRLWHGR